MTNYSTEQAARIVQIVAFVLGAFHKSLGIDNDTLANVIGALLFAGATIYGWIRRWQRGDLKLFGARVRPRY